MTQYRMTLLPDRGVVEVAGPDATEFLQGLTTNDVDRDGDGEGEAIFAGLLTPQGKILFEFFIVHRGPESYWLECPGSQAADVVRRLSMYKLRAKITVADRSAEFAVAAGWGEGAAPAAPGMLATYADPRYAPLGARFILPADGAAAWASASGAEVVGEAAYHAHRVALAVPQGGLDYAFGEAFPHEAGYDDLHGVDFEKGCYVGQEVVARMHHRGTAKTRIAGVELAHPLDASTDAGTGTLEIRAADLPVGVLGSVDGTHGLAMIRLDRAAEAMQQGLPLQAGEVTLTLRQPPWAQYSVPTAGGGQG